MSVSWQSARPWWADAPPPTGGGGLNLGGVNTGNYAQGNGLPSTVIGLPQFSLPPINQFEGLLGKFMGAEDWKSLM